MVIVRIEVLALFSAFQLSWAHGKCATSGGIACHRGRAGKHAHAHTFNIMILAVVTGGAPQRRGLLKIKLNLCKEHLTVD